MIRLSEPEHIAISRSKGIHIDWKDRHRSEYPLHEVIAEDVILLGGQGGGGGPRGGAEEFSQQPVSMPRGAQRSATPPPAQEDYSQGITDDDVPF
jgi:single-stranded DNA-binding protein